MRACIFCPNPRTTKRGEHIWDDWLNREHGEHLRFHYHVYEYGSGDEPIREYPARKLDQTSGVVCDSCNNTWMNELTEQAKHALEGFIRYDRSATLLELGILTTVCFAFMKSAVLDYTYEETRPPYISPSACSRFRLWLSGASDTPWLPDGLQVWIAWYRRKRQMEARTWINGLNFTSGTFKGYKVLLITYVVGSLALQITLPRWTKHLRKQGRLPSFNQGPIWDDACIPIWPGVHTARWPPPKYLDHAALEDFQKRFRTVNVPTSHE
jgi:hypothetical protein